MEKKATRLGLKCQETGYFNKNTGLLGYNSALSNRLGKSFLMNKATSYSVP